RSPQPRLKSSRPPHKLFQSCPGASCESASNAPGTSKRQRALQNRMKSAAKPASRRPVPAGRPWPLGVEWVEAEDAFNFALFSRHATGVTLLGYSEKDPAKPVFEFRFQHPAHKTGNIWHCRLPTRELRGAALYAYRVEGPCDPERGHRF